MLIKEKQAQEDLLENTLSKIRSLKEDNTHLEEQLGKAKVQVTLLIQQIGKHEAQAAR